MWLERIEVIGSFWHHSSNRAIDGDLNRTLGTKVRLVDVLFTNISGLGTELVDSKLVLVVLQPMRFVCGCNGVGVRVAGFLFARIFSRYYNTSLIWDNSSHLNAVFMSLILFYNSFSAHKCFSSPRAKNSTLSKNVSHKKTISTFFLFLQRDFFFLGEKQVEEKECVKIYTNMLFSFFRVI